MIVESEGIVGKMIEEEIKEKKIILIYSFI